MKSAQMYSQRRTMGVRRPALVVLAALGIAVAAGAVTPPLAGTAHAGSKPGASSGCSLPPEYHCYEN